MQASDQIWSTLRWTKHQDGRAGAGAYPITADDTIVLARAVAHEGEPRALVAWALLNRFAHLHPQYTTLAGFVRNYAQPISPHWFPDGNLHLAAMRKAEQEGDAEKVARLQAQAERRLRFATERWGDIDRGTRDLIVDLLHGRIAPPDAVVTEYHDPTGEGLADAQAFGARHHPALVAVDPGTGFPATGANWFYRAPGSESLRTELLSGPLVEKDGEGSYLEPCSLPE